MGEHSSESKTEKETQIGSKNGIEFAMSCMQGQGIGMFEANLCEPEFDQDIQLYAVFDSHCDSVAEYISKHFGKELKKSLGYKEKDFETALKQTFLKIDTLLKTRREEISQINYQKWLQNVYPMFSNIFKLNEEFKKNQIQKLRGELTYTACSANVTLIYNNQVYVASIGDSRCVLSSDGHPVIFSKDHKSDDPINSLWFDTDQNNYTCYTDRFKQSRTIEDLSFKIFDLSKTDDYQSNAIPHIVHYQFSEKDEFLLIGTQGIWELKTNQELISICRKNLSEKVPMNKIVENLLDQVITENTDSDGDVEGCGNMSMILVKIKPNIVINGNNDDENNDKNNSEGDKDYQIINKDDKNIENKFNALNFKFDMYQLIFEATQRLRARINNNFECLRNIQIPLYMNNLSKKREILEKQIYDKLKYNNLSQYTKTSINYDFRSFLIIQKIIKLVR